MKRSVYLNMKPVAEAQAIFLGAFDWAGLAGTERIATAESRGRATAGPVSADFSSPAYHCAAMDGYAVSASGTYGASDERPRLLSLDGQATPVNTGHPLPPETDAVIMVEQVHLPQDGQAIEIRQAAFPWQHVRKVGEDIVSQEMLLPHHHLMRPADVAALMQAGVFRLEVLQKPRVTVIPTGSELIDWRDAEKARPEPGSIIETNSLFISGMVSQAGAQATVAQRRPDEYELIKAAVMETVESDAHMVILNAGASAGSKDYTVHVIKELGEVLVHGIQAMPGKPTILGRIQGKPVIGSPGYPVSAWVCLEQFVAPALSLMQGQAPAEPGTIQAIPARPLASRLGQEEFIRVHLGRVGGQIVATPLKRGAGAITSLTRADGVIRIPANSDGAPQGEPVTAELLKPAEAVERTLVIVGSHDVTLDILADHIKAIDSRIGVSSSHVGSLAGLMAIREGRCHLGGTHLLDEDTGGYNIGYINKYLPGVPVCLVTLAMRSQGLIVKPGNPKGIREFGDLAREGVVMVNRQGGSGTRVLLDYHLGRLGIDPAGIRGYDNEEYTHMGVAVHVLSGGADVGLGVMSAARALNLDFVPLMEERYDLCIPEALRDDHRIRVLLEVLATDRFKQAVEALGGYDVAPMGRMLRLPQRG